MYLRNLFLLRGEEGFSGSTQHKIKELLTILLAFYPIWCTNFDCYPVSNSYNPPQLNAELCSKVSLTLWHHCNIPVPFVLREINRLGWVSLTCLLVSLWLKPCQNLGLRVTFWVRNPLNDSTISCESHFSV